MPDFEMLFQSVLMNDRLFFSLTGAAALFALLLAAILIRTSRGVVRRGEPIPRDHEKGERIVDQVIGEIKHEPEEKERIVEPVILPKTPTATELKRRKRVIEPATDTVEVYRNISTDTAADDIDYEIQQIGLPFEAEPIVVEKEPEPFEEPEAPPEPYTPEEEDTPEEEEKIEAPAGKPLSEGLAKTKSGFVKRLNRRVFGGGKISDEIFEEFEEILYAADIGPTATKLFESISENARRRDLKDTEKLRDLLREEITRILKPAEKEPFNLDGPAPKVILMVGVNGVGKTTTIGKVARKFCDEGKNVIIAAGDTFRAAAVEQLGIWCERSGAEMISAKEGANPSGIIYNAVEAARARGADLLIADTAGRLHTKYNLMEELKKIKAVSEKALGREVDEIWLVIDANTGQNAVAQAQKFHEALGLTGLILTKLDGTAKGGVVIGITDQLGLPIRYIGIGEKVEDLRPFKAEEFVAALLD